MMGPDGICLLGTQFADVSVIFSFFEVLPIVACASLVEVPAIALRRSSYY